MEKQAGLSDPVVAPVVPTPGAAVRLRPIGVVLSRVQGGMWAVRRNVNHNVTLPYGATALESAGNLFNFELAAGAQGSYRGGNDESGTVAPFLDSDVYKWLEAVGWELSQAPDPILLARAGEIMELLARAQRPDGYLDTFFQVLQPGREFTDLAWGHEMYVAGHLVQAAIAWQRGLGDARLLEIARRFVDRIHAEAGPGKRELICGHPEIEMSLVELYRLTGEARYLEFARVLLERRGHGLLGKGRFGPRYWQDHEPVRTAAEPAGHAVRQMYLDCGVVDLAIETGDEELLEAAKQRWANLVSTRMYLTGGLGSHHRDEAIGDPFELPPDRAYAETCAAIGSAMLSWRLLLATGESQYADVIERTAFNGILSGLASDGCHFFYSNPLMRRSGGAEVLEGAASTRRASWFPVSCCPPNLMRFLATWPGMIATTSSDGVQIHQFAPGTVEAKGAGGVPIKLEVDTSYPWDATVDFSIEATPAEPWTLSIRVPGWCSAAVARVGGVEGDADAAPAATSGPATIELRRRWHAGDRITVTMDMPAHATIPDPRIDSVRGTIALERGPIVYAVEDADLPDEGSVESLEVDESPRLEVVTDTASGLGELRSIVLDARLRRDVDEPAWPYGEASEPGATTARTTIRAVPYFAWGNRPGLGMRIWLPTIRDRDCAE